MKIFMFQADWFCEPCGEAIKETIDIATLPYPGEGLFREWYLDSDSFPIEYDSSEGESDTPDHCANMECELFLERNLTEDGIAYVRDAVEELKFGHGRNEIVQEWVDYYDIEIEVKP